MKTKFFNHLATGVVMFGGITIASTSALAQMTPSQNAEVKHLTCVKDAQGLMCKADDRDNTLAPQTESAAMQPASIASQILSSEQLGQFSNVLLGCLYFVLPTSLALAVFLHDQRSRLLSEKIELLERLWSQNPQH